MSQFEIDQAVAATLGEDIREISKHGFSLLDPQVEFYDAECDTQDPQVLDWENPGEASVQSFHDVAA